MKKAASTLLTILIISVITSCATMTAVPEPNDVGPYAFKVLKKLDNTSKEEFLGKLLTIETVREAVNDPNNGWTDRVKNEFTRMTKEDYNSRMMRDYERLKAKAAEYGILWKDITYIDYTYKAKEKNGLKESDGKLLFGYNSKTYSVSVSSLYMNNGYSIIELERLRKAN